MLAELVCKEFRRHIRGSFTPAIILTAALFTCFSGLEYLGRGKVSPDAQQLGMDLPAEEWAFRAPVASLGFVFLVTGIAVWFFFNRDRLRDTGPLVFARPIATRTLLLARILGSFSVVTCGYLTGTLVGIAIAAGYTGIAPDVTLFGQAVLLNTLPALFVWTVWTATASIAVGDLKSYAFILAVIWLAEAIAPFSLAWSFRDLQQVLQPARDPVVRWHFLGIAAAGALGLKVAKSLLDFERKGRRGKVRPRRSRPFRSRHPLWSKLYYHLRVTVGGRIVVAVLGSASLALILFGPWGPGSTGSLRTKIHFALSFSELLFPLFGLLIGAGILQRESNLKMEEILYQFPGIRTRLLGQKLVGIALYYAAVSLSYLTVLRLMVGGLSIGHAFAVLFPSMFFISSLAIGVSTLTHNSLAGYGVAGMYWAAAYFLEERFPWPLSPLYYLAEYTFKLQRDLFLANKVTILAIACLLFFSTLAIRASRMGEY